MRGHLPARDHGGMDPVPAAYVIRINGHLGTTVLSAFPALAPRWHGAHTVLTGLLDCSALYGMLALSWNWIGGMCGQMMLGLSLFVGIGAYTSTALYLWFGLTPWLGLPAGMALAAAVIWLAIAGFRFGFSQLKL